MLLLDYFLDESFQHISISMVKMTEITNVITNKQKKYLVISEKQY